MKKFLIRVISFLLPLVLLIIALDIWFSKSLVENSSLNFAMDECSVWNDVLEGKINADILIYGSSRAWVHFNSVMMEQELNCPTYNLGIDGLNFKLQHLRHLLYIKHNLPPKGIIVSVDFMTIQKQTELYNYQQFLPFMLWNKEMENNLSPYDLFHKTEFYIPFFRYINERNITKKVFTQSLQNKSVTGEKRQSGFLGRDKSWNLDLTKAKTNATHIKIEIDEQVVKLLDDFLGLCSKQNIRVLLVYAPLYVEGKSYIKNHNDIVDIFQELAKKYRLHFLDYTEDEICMNKSLFYNSAHLNEKGANLFTKKFIQDLKSNPFILEINN